ncbi:competence protein ComJ [Metabacillus arenae]|uniref:DNA-entry nuclease n=1 Tax=Metabacillus arenae TaxID=2771434 RepID=A0A926NHL6_9BACI|nr:competence protein ComJ [Metabacillus arenae]MBD1380728.1 DNA-entry nuclease [Metabacillus arenae]
MKKWDPQELMMSYHQFTVYEKGRKKPHHDWTDEAIKRGFIGDETSISFEAISNHKALIEVWLNVPEQVADAKRKLTVPFQVRNNGVEIKSILSNKLTFDLPNGNYSLTCFISTFEKNDSLNEYPEKYILNFLPSQ